LNKMPDKWLQVAHTLSLSTKAWEQLIALTPTLSASRRQWQKDTHFVFAKNILPNSNVIWEKVFLEIKKFQYVWGKYHIYKLVLKLWSDDYCIFITPSSRILLPFRLPREVWWSGKFMEAESLCFHMTFE
jgi:hypothetical protein